MKKIRVLFYILTAMFFAGCYDPSPLYGTWADNMGDKITFISGGGFVCKIKNSNDEYITYNGDYSVLDNSITFIDIPSLFSY